MTSRTLTPNETAQLCTRVLDEVERAVVGRRRSLELVLIGILAGGHILLEDLPGLGKTLIARSFAKVLGLDFARIQFTPDMLPSDVVGAPFYDQRSGEMVFRPGPVFTNLLLADEINRTPPKTQAALLEAMGEGQVSADGETRRLPQPFVVLATDNPIEYEGTYELPEAQLDRFVMRLRLGYLAASDEVAMVQRRLERGQDHVELSTVIDASELLAMRESLEQVEVSPDLLDYAVAIVRATRDHPQIQVGASPRGSLSLVQLARGRRWCTCATTWSPTTSNRSPWPRSLTGWCSAPNCGCARSVLMTSSPACWPPCRPLAPTPRRARHGPGPGPALPASSPPRAPLVGVATTPTEVQLDWGVSAHARRLFYLALVGLGLAVVTRRAELVGFAAPALVLLGAWRPPGPRRVRVTLRLSATRVYEGEQVAVDVEIEGQDGHGCEVLGNPSDGVQMVRAGPGGTTQGSSFRSTTAAGAGTRVRGGGHVGPLRVVRVPQLGPPASSGLLPAAGPAP